MIASGSQVTRRREEMASDERYLSSPSYPLWQAAGVGPIILSMRPAPGRGTSIAAFYRPKDAPAFSPRESRLAHILLNEVWWLHEAGEPGPAAFDIPKLSPRCRLILNQLVTGRSRKEIAADLSLSPHTINDYVKAIFRHFRVHSRAQLIARLRHGDGRDHGISSAGT
jgi:DNA-binding CsgD family transcriptional regulator